MREYSCLDTAGPKPPARSFAAWGILLTSLIVAAFAVDALAAGNGILKGRVYDYQTQKPIPEAFVAIQGTTKSVVADKNGVFQIELPEGKYGISIVKEEYYNTCYQDVEIETGKITTYKCELVAGDPKQQFFFAIGGITVLDKKSILPEKMETTHEISSADIEHYLSTNLGDIMDLVPGVETSENPGLGRMTQLDLRGSAVTKTTDEQQAARFGTKVIVDDITMSNNANLTTGTGTSYGSVNTYAGSGIDLRHIPADNIQKVEVITGVPSVEYGDLTTGLVKVTTKIGAQPNRLKLKSNPDTKEANLNGGWDFKGNNGLAYNLNYAYSERNIRLEGDEYSRINGQITFDNELLDKKMSLLNKFYYNGVIDEFNPPYTDPLARKQSNKDKSIIYGNSIEYKPRKDMKLDWTANIKYTKRDSYSQSLTGADVRVLTDATTPGTREGVYQAGAYLSQVWVQGEEYNVAAKLSFRYDVGLLHLNHSILTGGEYTFDNNVGQGRIFDPLAPPNGRLGQRPLPFDASPALHTANLYLEDNINGFLFMRPYNVNLGFRYEMYTPYKLHLDGIFSEEGVVESKNGTYMNPRVRMKYEPFEGSQVRLGWGKSSKMASIVDIYQGPEYIDIVEENVSPPDSVPLISTYVYEFNNRNLMGYQEEKGELSIDQKVGPTGFIVTGYYTSASNIQRQVVSPITLYRYRWTEWPSSAGRSVIDTIHMEPEGSFGYFSGVGWSKSWGIEAQLVTQRIQKLSTTFRISSAFVKNRSGADGFEMKSPVANKALGTVYPYYPYTESWGQRMIVSYSADWLIQKLGMWVTFFLQQTLFEKYQSPDDPSVYAVAYFDPATGKTIEITPEQSDEYKLTRVYNPLDLQVHGTPNDRVLFNINVSKSIGRSSEISLFVHNLFDDASYYQDYQGIWRSRNPDIFYGVEISTVLDNLWKRGSAGEGSGSE